MKTRRNFFRHDSPARELGRCCAEISKTGEVLTRRLRRAEEQLGCRHEILQRFLKKSQIPNSKIWILWRSAGRLKKFCRRWVLKLVSSELLLLTCWRISAALPDFPSTLRELDSGLEDRSKRVDHFRQTWWWIPDFILRIFEFQIAKFGNPEWKFEFHHSVWEESLESSKERWNSRVRRGEEGDNPRIPSSWSTDDGSGGEDFSTSFQEFSNFFSRIEIQSTGSMKNEEFQEKFWGILASLTPVPWISLSLFKCKKWLNQT